jgi:hypothetical protein
LLHRSIAVRNNTFGSVMLVATRQIQSRKELRDMSPAQIMAAYRGGGMAYLVQRFRRHYGPRRQDISRVGQKRRSDQMKLVLVSTTAPRFARNRVRWFTASTAPMCNHVNESKPNRGNTVAKSRPCHGTGQIMKPNPLIAGTIKAFGYRTCKHCKPISQAALDEWLPLAERLPLVECLNGGQIR